ncbi:MAG: flagellar filament capping protein FliD [Ignavibacteria bacterium]|nr:flagellar filament capping protein FliD [Ignavibacteria bacterium]
MAYDLLTPAGINSFIDDYRASETKKQVDPLTKKKKNTDDLNAAYTELTNKLNDLKTISYAMQLHDTSSAFLLKKASSSDSKFVDITATSAAVLSSQSIRVNQLAKSDLVISQDLTSTAANSTIVAPGTHDMTFTAGDGVGGTFTSKVSVTFEAADFTAGTISNANVIAKIQNAINTSKATVLSNSVSGSTASAGAFNLNLNGTVTAINYTAGTYSGVIDSVVTQINALNGIQAEKIDGGGGNYSLKLTVTDSSKYLTINGDTSGLLTELGVSVTNEKGASGLLSASTFSPDSTLSQLSIAAKKSGEGYKLLSLSDSTGSLLTSVGLNLGGTRTSFVQNTSGSDTPGYVYATTALNAKIEFNGISVERNSNQISDLVPGATINLKSLMQPTDTTVNLDIASDSAKITEKIQDFIKKFNDIYIYLKEKTKSTKDGRGLLIGDSTAESFKYLFSNMATSSVAGINTDEVNTLSKLGLSFNVSEGLSVGDSSKLDKLIKEKPEQVEALFNSTNGIATTLHAKILPYVNATGYLYKRKTSFGIESEYLDDRITAVQDRINLSASNLRLRYMKSMSQTNALVSNQSIFFMKSLNY